MQIRIQQANKYLTLFPELLYNFLLPSSSLTLFLLTCSSFLMHLYRSLIISRAIMSCYVPQISGLPQIFMAPCVTLDFIIVHTLDFQKAALLYLENNTTIY